MLNKKELANKLINNETINPYYPEWKEFYTNNQIPNNLIEYKKLNYELYENIILWKYANGGTKEEIMKDLVNKLNMIKEYKIITEYDKAILNIIVELLNKYFTIQPIETHIGILNDQKVAYTWNKLLKYELIEPIKNIPYQLKVDLEDWINHKVNGQIIGKFSVDPNGHIFNVEVI